ncbi:type III-B CRISPR module RAMP protein Cmr4 [Saccharolobus shibatae]|uniref:CRISPR-associated RAMP Cmr4 n=1 Tax=Saccharolobus shibatae TaxID=2286 RepID=A0A8F5GZ45_9CREN|nr:type III-B CRISPR module RAMP protein Cmr4 [Saccharolobus shibatae]QXJ34934.1 CRISPR-associated RAMP Cmr4 [Saccharolobus shibatae]
MVPKYLVLAYAITPIHVGAGKSSTGVVDSPFVRDSIGYPIVYGSSLKGSLKSFLMTKNERLAKCVFGGKPEEENILTSKYVLTDFIPVFYPVSSIDEGYIYITTRYLINHIEDLLSRLGISSLYKESKEKSEVRIFLGKIGTESSLQLSDEVKSLGNLIKDKNRVYVLDNSIGLSAVESALTRVTRTELDDNTKTSKNIWSEEYIPQGTILLGGIFEREISNNYCEELNRNNVNIDNEFLKLVDNVSVFIGGKESIGKGLTRIKLKRVS